MYEKFSTLTFDIENNSKEPLYIKKVVVLMNESKRAIKGAIEFPKKIKAGSVAELVYVTLNLLQETNMKLVVTTNIGDIEVNW